jgi:predicted DNA-binding transcriptional regulator AlpA
MLDTYEVAARLKKTPRTIKRWRAEKTGPPYVKTPSGAVLYPEDQLEKWIQDWMVIA